jgi:D-alanyl-D-alanine carboxypeptidase
MFQPKRRKRSTPVNRLLTLVISGGLIFGAAVGPAFGAGATPTPSPENTHQAEIPVTPSPDVSIDPVPTPMPSTPVVCGICFNPGANSLTKANSLWVVANKQRPLNPITYRPAIGYFKGVQVAKVTAAALSQMAAAMLKDKAGTLLLNSGYRSYDTQVVVHDRQVKHLGLKAGEALAARPGYSEHQTGLAADVSAAGQGCTIQVCFAKTKAGKWLAANAWQYGFILRYPDGQTATTGYQFEPWHFRYVGVELATEMKSQNVTVLEKFWKLPAAPSYSY